ncbi:MAG: lauroyl acyltransferase [Alphaproteobacteria bacterium]|nr:lauroyl acyltransferase [Alphaproteobacteria bacterium]
MLHRLRYRIEAALVLVCYGVLKVMPLDMASALGGFVARVLGPRIGLSNRARRNMRRFMPELGEAGIEKAVVEMWDNLGRLAAEYPHLDDIRIDGAAPRVEIVGHEHVRAAQAAGRPAIFYGAHLANWELGAMLTTRFGTPLHVIYREANNRYVEALFRSRRSRTAGGMIPKGKKGARMAIDALRKGEWLGMLLDQKMNDGMPVPFFGVDAMTAPALATLALRFNCAVLGARLERLGGARFRIEIQPPLELPNSGDRTVDQFAIMRTVNAEIERWVRARPGQWLWLHRRWPDA